MVQMKRLLILLLPLVLFSSCFKIILKLYGVKQPRIENEKSIRKKTHHFGLDTTNIVTVNSKDFLRHFKDYRLPDASLFDSAGNYIEYRPKDSACNAGLFDFIPSLNKTQTYDKTGKTTLQTEWNKYRGLRGQNLNALPAADFYVFIYYTVWLGKLNKDHVAIWEDQAKQNKQCKIKVVKVNLDLQTWWDKAERDRIIKAMEKKKK